jgi:hypothetical protein
MYDTLLFFLSFYHSFNEQFYLSYILQVIHGCQFQVYYWYKLLKNNTYEPCYYCESVIAKRTRIRGGRPIKLREKSQKRLMFNLR